MTKIISFFNHKGGVSKTTTLYHLAWMMSEMGHRTLMIDSDSQCNLTGLILGDDRYEDFYEKTPDNNIKSALNPAFSGEPSPISEIEGVDVKNNLWLIPGHIDITEFDISLGMAHNFSASMQVLMNLPGAFSAFIDRMTEKYKIEYVFIDMNPSLSEINKNLLMISDYFIIPTAPDFFSQMALNTLSSTLPKWKKWSIVAKEFFKDTTYPFPDRNPKFLGVVMQNFTIRKGKPASAFQNKINEVFFKLKNVALPSFDRSDLSLSGELKAKQMRENHCLASIPNFQSLVAKMQESGAPSTPVYAIDPEYLGTGIIRDDYIKRMESFRDIFFTMAESVVELTRND